MLSIAKKYYSRIKLLSFTLSVSVFGFFFHFYLVHDQSYPYNQIIQLSLGGLSEKDVDDRENVILKYNSALLQSFLDYSKSFGLAENVH